MAEEGMPCMPKVPQCTSAVIPGLVDQAEQPQWRPYQLLVHSIAFSSWRPPTSPLGCFSCYINWQRSCYWPPTTMPVIEAQGMDTDNQWLLPYESASCQAPREVLCCSLMS